MALGDAAFSDGDIMRRLRLLERRADAQDAARRLESATIGAGGLRVKGEGGVTLQNGGDLVVEDDGGITVVGGGDIDIVGGALRMTSASGVRIFDMGPQASNPGNQILILRRDDGSTMFTTGQTLSGKDFWGLMDSDGRIIVGDDAESGVGLARPWLQVPMYMKFIAASGPLYGAATIDAADIAAESQLWEGRVSVSHPRIVVHGVWGQASGSNTTIYRLKIGGTQVGSWTIGSQEVSSKGPFDIASKVGQDDVSIEITADASGTGLVSCQVLAVVLRQS